MRFSLRNILICIFILANSVIGFASPQNVTRNHLIIAVDQFVNYRHILQQKDFMLRNIDNILNIDGKKLLNDNDYISVVTFGIGRDNPNFDYFAVPSKVDGKEIAWIPYKERNKIFKDWNQLINRAPDRFNGSGYSILTASKPFSIAALKSPNNAMMSDRTYMLMITDDHYNGFDNYRKEFHEYQITGGRASRNQFDKVTNTYNTLFRESEIRRIAIADGLGAPYYLILVEIIPTSKPSIYSIIDIPASLNIHRTPGGYNINFAASTTDDLYELNDIEVRVMKSNGDSICTHSGNIGAIDLFIPKSEVDINEITVKVIASVLQKDDFYNGIQVSPYNPNTPRMISVRTLSVKEEGKIYGMPMPDFMWWWFHDDISKAAFLWEIIILLILVLLVIGTVSIFNKKTAIYNLHNNEIGIRVLYVTNKQNPSRKSKTKEKRTEQTDNL